MGVKTERTGYRASYQIDLSRGRGPTTEVSQGDVKCRSLSGLQTFLPIYVITFLTCLIEKRLVGAVDYVITMMDFFH